MKHTLTITPDYVQDWDEWSGARELIQNALDQSETNGQTPVVKWENKVLTIGVKNCELSPRTLLLGQTSKRSDPSKRGQFGEGYKLALLVFARRLYSVEIRTGAELWTASIVHDNDYNCDLLQIERKQSESVNGVWFSIGGVSEPMWRLIESRYLPDTPNDTILPNKKGMIFVGGLFVREERAYEYGYNFAPSRIKLGRDRDLVADFDIEYNMGLLWQSGQQSAQELFDMLDRDAKDTRRVSYVPGSIAQVIVEKYENKYGPGTTPVANQEQLDAARGQGIRARIIPDAMRGVLTGFKSFLFYDQTTPGYKMQEFMDKYGDRMDLDVRDEFAMLVEASKSWRS